MDIKNKNILIIGFGKTGHAIAAFLQNKGSKIYVYDENIKSDYINIDKNFDLNNIDFAVISPGISYENEFVLLLIEKGIKIYSEIDFASFFIKSKVVAVTGTNGKTTTVSLIGSILNEAGKENFVCGNIGEPLINFIEKDNATLVVEVSSFQLEQSKIFKPDIAVILNITSDHLNRHKTYENYFTTKCKIFNSQSKKDWLILNQNLKGLISSSKQIFFQNLSENRNKNVVCYKKGEFVYFKKKKILKIEDIKLLGEKNLENIMASICVCKCLDIDNKFIKSAIKKFEGLSHRLQLVAVKNGVTYINDSKATNVDGAVSATLNFNNIIWLVGGCDKGYEYNEIFECKNIKKIIAFGSVKEKIIHCANHHHRQIISCEKLKDAVKVASQLACKGDTVLLSPASASFDEFENYKQRGEMFIKWVGEL